MNFYKSFHPTVNFFYFLSVILFTMTGLDPVCIGISFLLGFIFALMNGGKKVLRSNILFLLPLFIVSSLINPLINHRGQTILFYLKSGNPFTLESCIYGILASGGIVAVINHFYSFNEIMTSDKIMYLFGKTVPSLSLVFSMTLRFVPRFMSIVGEVSAVQKTLGNSVSSGKITKRIKSGLSILSVSVSRALENSVETADSMKSRGYDLSGRSSYSYFVFSKRDIFLLILTACLSGFVIFAKVKRLIYFSLYPNIRYASVNASNIIFYIMYLILFFLPVIIEVKEGIKWKYTMSRI